MKWFKQLKKYLGLDLESGSAAEGDSSAHPGPIDNSALFKPPNENEPGELREHLLEELDYSLLPEDAWALLYEHFSLTEGQEPIVRKVCSVRESLLNGRLGTVDLLVKISCFWYCKDYLLFASQDTWVIRSVVQELSPSVRVSWFHQNFYALVDPRTDIAVDKADETLVVLNMTGLLKLPYNF